MRPNLSAQRQGIDLSSFPILSFFSGAGFLDLGFLKAGFEIAWHNECHKPFVRAYETGIKAAGYNSGNCKIQSTARIENLNPARILLHAFPNKEPCDFGIIGGPPCPDFSVAGKNQGRKGKSGGLTRNYVTKIIGLRPSFFLLENVAGLLETKKHRDFLFGMIKRLNKNSYAVDVKILNALAYGVPQHRRRVFVIGFARKWLRKMRPDDFRKFVDASEKIASIDISERRNRAAVEADLSGLHWFSWPRAREIDAIVSRSKKCPEKLSVGWHFKGINGHENAMDRFRPKSPKFTRIDEGDVSRKSFKRLSRQSFSPNAAYGNNEVHLHPTEPRRISVAEALFLQSVPPEYFLPAEMTLSDKFKAVGNGVPVKMAEQIAASVLSFLNQEKIHETF